MSAAVSHLGAALQDDPVATTGFLKMFGNNLADPVHGARLQVMKFMHGNNATVNAETTLPEDEFQPAPPPPRGYRVQQSTADANPVTGNGPQPASTTWTAAYLKLPQGAAHGVFKHHNMESVYNNNLHTVLTTPAAHQAVHATEMYQVVDMVKLYLGLHFQINWPNAVREVVKLPGVGQYMLRPVAAEVMYPAGMSGGFPWGFYTCRYSATALMCAPLYIQAVEYLGQVVRVNPLSAPGSWPGWNPLHGLRRARISNAPRSAGELLPFSRVRFTP